LQVGGSLQELPVHVRQGGIPALSGPTSVSRSVNPLVRSSRAPLLAPCQTEASRPA
jgi:hypothetical protein